MSVPPPLHLSQPARCTRVHASEAPAAPPTTPTCARVCQVSSWRRYEYGLSKLVVFVHTWEVEPFSKAFPGVEFHGVTDFHTEAVKHRFFVYKVRWGSRVGGRGGAGHQRGGRRLHCRVQGGKGKRSILLRWNCPRQGGLKQCVA